MYDFESQREIVGYAHNDNGVPTHAASIIPDPKPAILMEGLADQFKNAGLYASIRIVQEPFLEPFLARLRKEYYEINRGTRLEEAWGRFFEEYASDDAIEIFTRYAAAFHPRTVIHNVNLQTGNSQGDRVELIMWLEADVIDDQWTHFQARDMPLIVRQARATEQAYNCLTGYCEEFEQAATGEAYGIALHEITMSYVDGMELEERVEVIFELGEPEDECWGFIGREYAAEEAKALLPK